MDEVQEGGQRLLASQGDAAEALELVGEALDLMAFLTKPPIDGRRDGPAGIDLDLRGGAKIVGDDMTDALQAGQEGFSLRAITMLSRCRVNADG